MLQKFSLKRIVPVAAAAIAGIVAFSAPAQAEFEQGDYELRLSGFAQNDSEFSGFAANADAALGWFFSDQSEVGLRQTYSYTDVGGPGSASDGTTVVFFNYHFGQDGNALVPFIGANLGYAYGDSVDDTFIAGPEGGVKYFVDENWFIFGEISYQFFFEDTDDAGDNFNDGLFNYGLGIGTRI